MGNWLLLLAIFTVLWFIYLELKKIFPKDKKWIRNSQYPVYTEGEIEAQYVTLRKYTDEIDVSLKKEEEIRKRVKESKNPKEDTTLRYEMKEASRKAWETAEAEKNYKFMIQSNIDVISGKKTMKEADETEEAIDLIVGSMRLDKDLEKDVDDWIDRITKKS